MSFEKLPQELLEMITECCETYRDFSALTRTSRFLHDSLGSRLFSYNIKHHRNDGLYEAAVRGNIEAARRFLATPGVDINRSPQEPPPRRETKASGTCDPYDAPLMVAVKTIKVEMAIFLLDHGADPETGAGQGGRKPLYFVVCYKMERVLKKMFEVNADTTQSILTFGTKILVTMAGLAARRNSLPMVELLLDDMKARNPHLLQHHQWDALVGARKHNNDAVIKHLLERQPPPSKPPPPVSLPVPTMRFRSPGEADLWRTNFPNRATVPQPGGPFVDQTLFDQTEVGQAEFDRIVSNQNDQG